MMDGYMKQQETNTLGRTLPPDALDSPNYNISNSKNKSNMKTGLNKKATAKIIASLWIDAENHTIAQLGSRVQVKMR